MQHAPVAPKVQWAVMNSQARTLLVPTGTHGNAGQANYATAKAGIIGLTKTVAKVVGYLGLHPIAPCRTILLALLPAWAFALAIA